MVVADYVTEREATAIRGMIFGGWLEDCRLMTIEFKDREGRFSVPIDTVKRYHEDWQRSGQWSIAGTKGDARVAEKSRTCDFESVAPAPDAEA